MSDQTPSPSTPHTRGFLFADLRGYSKFTEKHGDAAAAELIGRYRKLVRTEIAAFHGAEIRTEGDSFYVVFGVVSQAVQAGLAIRDAAAKAGAQPGLPPINVGIGIHAGESTDGSQGIVSSAVNIAARVCAVAKPGEVLVTDIVRGLVRSSIAVQFTSRGRRRLKGISEPIAVFSVAAMPDGPVAKEGRVRHRRIAFVGVIGLVVAAAVVVQGAMTSGTGARGTQPSSASTSSPEAAEETHDLGRFTDPGEFPNAEETALMEQLAADLTSSCDRVDPSTYPAYSYPATEDEPAIRVPLAIRAGLMCLTGGNNATYLQVATPSFPRINTAEELFGNLLFRRSIEEGSCTETARAYEEWTSGAHTGHVMCFMRDGEAVVEWTYVDANIYAIATRRDGDLAALYAWWEDVGRRLSR